MVKIIPALNNKFEIISFCYQNERGKHMMFDNNISCTERKKRTHESHSTKCKIQNNRICIYKQVESNKMSPRQFFFGQCTILPDFVLYSGDESGVDGDKNKGVGVYKGDCKGLKLGVSVTSK